MEVKLNSYYREDDQISQFRGHVGAPKQDLPPKCCAPHAMTSVGSKVSLFDQGLR